MTLRSLGRESIRCLVQPLLTREEEWWLWRALLPRGTRLSQREALRTISQDRILYTLHWGRILPISFTRSNQTCTRDLLRHNWLGIKASLSRNNCTGSDRKHMEYPKTCPLKDRVKIFKYYNLTQNKRWCQRKNLARSLTKQDSLQFWTK